MPDARKFPRYAGVATFLRFPRIEVVPAEHQPVDWALYGVPFDGGVTYRPGARFAPRAIRAESQYIKPAHLEHEVNIAELMSMADAGDAPVSPFDAKQNIDATIEFAMQLGEARHTRLLAVGGDHSIAYANIAATWRRRGKPRGGLALLHFDAHLDTVDVIAGSKWSHGSVFRRAIEDGLIDPQRMLSMGVRGPLNALSDLDFAREQGINLVPTEQLGTELAESTIRTYCDRIADDPVYLSFDIDCIDPAYAPGTGTPSCGGLTSAEAFALLRRFAGANLVGADVVEVLPDRDVGGVTSLLASHIVFEILSLVAVREKVK